MKKWIAALAVLALIVGGWYVARKQRFTPPWAMPKTAKVTRGDITVPISASGLIQPYQNIDVKSKASGEVIDVPVVEGSFVRQGDTLVVLKKIDEQRSVDRARSDLQRSEAMVEQAKVAKKTAQANVLAAEAEIARLEAEIKVSAFQLKKVTVDKPEMYNNEEHLIATSHHDSNLALKKAAEARLQNANNAVEDAAAAIKAQEAVFASATTTLADAEERLKETTVISQHDAIVTAVYVRKGMLVQSGTSSFTGGSPVMKLADVSKKKVVTRVDEADYGRVLAISPIGALPDMPGLREAAQRDAEQLSRRIGKVRLTVDAFPDRSFEGRIERVEPQGNLNAGSSVIQFDVHVEITDADRYLLPLGAQAQVEFTIESAHDVLRVAAEAVKTNEEKKGVWVKTQPQPGSDERFPKRFVPCRLGITDGEFTQVLEVLPGGELKEGDDVYTKLPPKDEE